MTTIYLITHPEVVVDPSIPVPQWPLSERGRERMRALLGKAWVGEIASIYCSTEQKAVDGAAILAEHLSLPFEEREELGENDRSSTGYLPKEEFEATADEFFAHPGRSVRGWETASDAQRRIVRAVQSVLGRDRTSGSIAIVSHGGVGTLLLCHLAGRPIERSQDQPGGGGGNYYAFCAETQALIHGWRPIDG